MIYIICGGAKSGKTTFGNLLKDNLKNNSKKPCVMQLTGPLYHYAEDYFTWDRLKDEKPREFLQRFGIEILKEKLNKPHFLLNRLTEDIEVLDTFFDTFIISDVRFNEEIEFLKDKYKDVVVIKLIRPFFDDELTIEQKMHVTEKAVDEITEFDYLVQNKSLKDLEKEAEKIVESTLKRGE